MAEGTNSSGAYDILLKILLIGDTDSRKSELLHRYLGTDKLEDQSPTLGERERASGRERSDTG